MPLIPWGDYRPDVSDYQGRHTRAVQNVLPQGDDEGFGDEWRNDRTANSGGMISIFDLSNSPFR